MVWPMCYEKRGRKDYQKARVKEEFGSNCGVKGMKTGDGVTTNVTDLCSDSEGDRTTDSCHIGNQPLNFH